MGGNVAEDWEKFVHLINITAVQKPSGEWFLDSNQVKQILNREVEHIFYVR